MDLRMLCLATIFCLSQAEPQSLELVKIVNPATLTSTRPRIVGGTPTTIAQYPYTVQVAQNDRLRCGGSLITRRHVLSAAHCFVESVTAAGVMTLLDASLLSIRAGTSILNSGGQSVRARLFVNHESYNPWTLDNDIAVMLLRSDVTLNANVAVASIPTQNSAVAYNTTLVTVGWGTTYSGATSLSNVLLEVQVQKVNLTDCMERYRLLAAQIGATYYVTANMVCAGRLGVGGADACQGDSGGPLVALFNTNVVMGVTSWGHGCGDPQYPGVSARVASYSNWINATVVRHNNAPSLKLSSSLFVLVSLVISYNKLA